jgi:hypothetical protein
MEVVDGGERKPLTCYVSNPKTSDCGVHRIIRGNKSNFLFNN